MVSAVKSSGSSRTRTIGLARRRQRALIDTRAGGSLQRALRVKKRSGHGSRGTIVPRGTMDSVGTMVPMLAGCSARRQPSANARLSANGATRRALQCIYFFAVAYSCSQPASSNVVLPWPHEVDLDRDIVRPRLAGHCHVELRPLA